MSYVYKLLCLSAHSVLLSVVAIVTLTTKANCKCKTGSDMDLRSHYLVVCYTDACTSKIYKSFENMMMPKAGDEV